MHGIVEHVYCLVHGLHDLHGVWCVFQGWDVSTLGNILSGYVTQDPSVGASELGLYYPPYLPCSLLSSCFVFTAVWCGIISFVKTHLSSPDPILAYD